MAGRTLVLLRHAKSDWDGEEADIDRPLARRGRREAPDAGRWINDNLPALDLAVVSPALRARETWDLVAAELGATPAVRFDEHIYAASVDDLLAVVGAWPAEAATVLLVGHNPGLEELVHLLTGGIVPMPTSAIAVLDSEDGWSTLSRATVRTSGRPPAPPR